jgi:hypothetical protein
MFEASFAYEWHTNCQDTLAEAIREYGLTPDDTHDSLNFWMDTRWDADGNWDTAQLNAKPGDGVALVALMDVLAVPVVCGSGDISGVSNYQLNSIRVSVHEATDDSMALVAETERYAKLRNQRSPSDFAAGSIRTERELRRDPTYDANYRRTPIRYEAINVELTEDHLAIVDRLLEVGIADDPGVAIRAAAFEFIKRRHTAPSPFQDPIRDPASQTS